MTITHNKLRKSKSPRRKKFRLLLDSAFAKPEAFPKLRRKANLAHSVHDFKLSPQAEDQEIYQRAIQDNRFVLTINFNDFRKLTKENRPGIIGIESQLSNQEIDQKVSKFLSDKNPDDYKGKATKI